MFRLQSSNPALKNESAFNPYSYREDGADVAARPDVATMQGVVNKTILLVLIAIAAGAFGYWLVGQLGWSAVIITMVGGLVVTIGAYIAVSRKPVNARIVGPICAVFEGAFLGALSTGLEKILVAQNIKVPGGLAMQAFLIAGGIMVGMLLLYKLRILRPTRLFVATVSTLTAGCMLAYALTWILWLFGMELPFISLGSAFQGGTAALIGIGINVLFLVVASLGLIIDFGEVEARVNSGAPKATEWYCGFILLVSLAWIYFEAVKLVFRLALLFNRE